MGVNWNFNMYQLSFGTYLESLATQTQFSQKFHVDLDLNLKLD